MGQRKIGLVFVALFLLGMFTLAFKFSPVVSRSGTDGSWVWFRDTITGAWGEAVVGTGDAIYIARGDGFYRYRPADDSWTLTASPSKPDGSAFKTGTALAWDFGDYVYALFGAATDDSRRWFYRYSISSNSWETLANTTADQGEGNAITWVDMDNRIYATIGGEQRPTYFMRYDPSANSWSDMPADPPAGMGDGASLVWTGGEYLYGLRGEFIETAPLYDFWRYSLTDDAWTVVADIPALPHGGRTGGVGDGGSLLYVGFWLPSHTDYVYALSGNQAHPDGIPDNRTYRYTISTNSWERLADLPFGVGYYVGRRLGYADGRIYAWQGAPSTWTGGGDDLAKYRVAWIVDDDGPADFSKIQEAINAANTGDAIFVYNGTYYENVVVNKTVSLIGENVGGAIIDGGGIGTVVTVQTSNVSINGFTIRNSGAEWQGSWWDSAILLNNSNNNILVKNDVINNHCGMWLEGAANNTITRNYVSANSMRGIILVNSVNNVIIENNVTGNDEGISLLWSFNNSLRNNVMFGNRYNFGIFGEILDHFIQDIDVSNTVNAKPIYYLINQNNLVINSSTFPKVGYLGLVNSTNIMVKGLDLTHNVQGVLIAYSSNSKIENNKLTDTVYGISLVDSATNIIAENDLTDNLYGVGLRYSLNNTLSENNITKNVRGVLLIYSANNNTITKNDIVANEFTGIDLTASTYNVIYGNNVTDNRYGMWVDYSSNNSIYHNNFVDNTIQVDTSNSVNVWDNGYSSGGNYWSNYSGVDEKSGPYQDEPGSDGLGDIPYVIDENNHDNYPLMNLWTPPVDLTPPLTTIGLSGVLGDNGWFTSDVTATLSATDDTKVDKTEYSFESATWITYATPFTIINEGNTVVYYRSTDKARNSETVKTTTIKIDKTAPSGAITIQNDVAYTTSTSVTLTLSAADATSGEYQVRFSKDGVWDTEPWETSTPTKTWTLTSGDGTKTVYYQIKDNAGLISSYSDSIILDTTKPTANAGVDQAVNEDILVTFDASTSTDENGIGTYTWTFTDLTVKTLIGERPTYTFNTPGVYNITLNVTDAAGNWATDTTTVIVRQAEAPTPPPTEAFPVGIIGTAIAAIGIAMAAILLLRKRK
ncbi:MAG TPA: NosD domain-containing protein [Candidatus Bathyarchaeia archaeon]|nr:NosD domain-containing protein [Candidatus Bathyarchaeia archaeon]